MIRIKFHNMDPPRSVKEAVYDRLFHFWLRYPKLEESIVSLQVSAVESPAHSTPIEYTVKLSCHGGEFHGLVIEKSDSNFFKALRSLVDSLKVSLARKNQKHSTKVRQTERRLNPRRETSTEVYWKRASGD